MLRDQNTVVSHTVNYLWSQLEFLVWAADILQQPSAQMSFRTSLWKGYMAHKQNTVLIHSVKHSLLSISNHDTAVVDVLLDESKFAVKAPAANTLHFGQKCVILIKADLSSKSSNLLVR